MFLPFVVIAGGTIYNGVNPFLAASGPADWPKSVTSVDRIADLNPKTVIADVRCPSAATMRHTCETREYLEQFIEFFGTSADSRNWSGVQELYPDHVNPSAFVMSAVTAFKRKKRQHPCVHPNHLADACRSVLRPVGSPVIGGAVTRSSSLRCEGLHNYSG